MLTLEQVRALEDKVLRLVEYNSSLRGENRSLVAKLGDYQRRIGELEVMISAYRQEQKAIEDGVLQVLDRLERIEEEAKDDTSSSMPMPTTGSDDQESPWFGTGSGQEDVIREEAPSESTEAAPEEIADQNQDEENSPAVLFDQEELVVEVTLDSRDEAEADKNPVADEDSGQLGFF